MSILYAPRPDGTELATFITNMVRAFLTASLILGTSFGAVAEPAVFSPARCSDEESPVWLVLKESFRFQSGERDGTHRYLLLIGCKEHLEQVGCGRDGLPCEIDTYRVTGTVYFGKEADPDYRNTIPNPISNSNQSIAFHGIQEEIKRAAHGKEVQISSDQGDIRIEGDFYSNRGIQFTVGDQMVPASLIQ